MTFESFTGFCSVSNSSALKLLLESLEPALSISWLDSGIFVLVGMHFNQSSFVLFIPETV